MTIVAPGCRPRKGRHPKHTSSGPGDRAAFPLAVPDYVQADWFIARPKPRPSDDTGRPRRGRPRIGGLHWAIHRAVIVHKTSRVIVADVVLAHVLWGGDRRAWPRNWRGRLVRRLKRMATPSMGLSQVVHREGELGARGCPAGCALHGTHTRHQHLEVTITTPPESPAPEEGGGLAEPEYSETFLGALEVFGYGGNAEGRGSFSSTTCDRNFKS